ncbi:type IV pili methyl-accepting chemotaxis transducer N-terminal domain-containing protein [Sulfitobacter sp.]|uniref:type IV pili methyl-accepting chemotaxis transducer N-terminal domain-containing protein n=1 Tax=Sulfitobacter sp. TaxID=1903071 RepID=UPI0030027DA6
MKSTRAIDRRTLLKLVSSTSIIAMSILAFSPSIAAAAIDISHKIKIAGDLRMFTQRMALSAAFVMLDVEKNHYLDVLREEYDEFESDIAALRMGDSNYAMEPEQNKLVLEAINTVEFGWKALGPELKAVIETDAVDEAQFTKIEKTNTLVMTLADSLIHRILLEYKEEIPLGLAYQIDVVGTQRTLSQKMIKEAILVALGFDVEAHHEMLTGSVQLFQFGLDKLAGQMQHNGQTLPTPSEEISKQLSKAKHCWAKLQPILEKLDQSHQVSPDEVQELAKEADVMLAAFDVMSDVLIKEAELV